MALPRTVPDEAPMDAETSNFVRADNLEEIKPKGDSLCTAASAQSS
jgi:hypothetical protein